jgi:uncharacterized protein
MFDIAGARYVSLLTFKRDGTAVQTPVWIAPFQGKHYVFSAENAGKVKRLRHTARVRLAQCSGTGKVLSDWIDGQAHLIGAPEATLRAHQALRAKYGVMMWLADVGAKLTGRIHHRTYIEISI